jgi:hypothetical protein
MRSPCAINPSAKGRTRFARVAGVGSLDRAAYTTLRTCNKKNLYTAQVRIDFIRVTPAMETGLTDHVWSLEEMCATLPAQASAAKRIDSGLILKALGEKVR